MSKFIKIETVGDKDGIYLATFAYDSASLSASGARRKVGNWRRV